MVSVGQNEGFYARIRENNKWIVLKHVRSRYVGTMVLSIIIFKLLSYELSLPFFLLHCNNSLNSTVTVRYLSRTVYTL